MTKTKQTRRMIAMALAASVATSAMPVTAFADTVTNADGSTTTTNSTTNADGSTTTNSTTTSADGNTVSNTTATDDGKGNTSSTTTTTENTAGGGLKVTVEVVKDSTSTTDNQTPDSTPDATPDSTPDSAEGSNGDPTGQGGTGDVTGDGNTDATDEFVSSFVEQENTETKNETTDISHTEESTTTETKANGFKTGESGTNSGSESSSTVVVEVEKQEIPDQEATDAANANAGTPDVDQPENPVDEQLGQFDDNNNQAMTDDELEDVNAPELDLEFDANAEQDLTGSVTTDGPVNNGVDEDGNPVQTVVKEYLKDWTETYNALVEKATATVTGAAQAEAQTVKDADGNAVTMGAVTATENKDANGKVTSYTYTCQDETGKYVKTVTVTPTTDADGNVTFTTTAELVVTPDYEKTGEESAELKAPEYSYEFGDVEETQAVPTVDVVMPAAPEVGAVATDEATKKTMTTVAVEDHYEDVLGDGNMVKVGYKKTVEIKNEFGEVIGTGYEIVKGDVTVKEVVEKTVNKTTTIDTFTQTTTTEERTVTKEVTTSTVTMDVSETYRKLIVKMLSAGVTGDHGDIDTLTSIIANRGYYENLYTNDDLRKEMQWVGTNTTTGPNGSRDMNNVTHYAQAGEFDLVGYGMYSDLLVWRDKANGDDMYGDVRQYILHDSEGNDFYTYCVEMGQGLNWGSDYVVENLDEVDYFKGGQEAKDHIRTIVLNGFWGSSDTVYNEDGSVKTEAEKGSMDAVKAMLKENNWTDAEIASLTPGQAMAATQAAIWYYGNDGGQKLHDLDHIIRRSYNAGWVGENEVDNTNVVKMFNTLIGLDTTVAPEEKETNLIDLEDITATITAKEKVENGTEDIDNDGKVDDKYNTDVSFTLAVIPGDNDSLNVVVVDNHGTVLESKDLRTFGSTGDYVKTTDGNGNTTYTMKNIQLTEGVTINLSIDGTQHLKNGVYVYRSENFDTSNVDAPHSQTMVGIAEGKRDVSLDMNLTFSVDDPTDATQSSSKSGHTNSRNDKKITKTNSAEREMVVTALMEVTTTTTTTTGNEWDGGYAETWTEPSGGGSDPKDPEDPKDPTDPEDPTDIPEDDVPLSDTPGADEEAMEIGDEEVPLAAAPLVAGAEEDPMVLGDEEELIAATGDDNHVMGFGAMALAALAGMFGLRKKEN